MTWEEGMPPRALDWWAFQAGFAWGDHSSEDWAEPSAQTSRVRKRTRARRGGAGSQARRLAARQAAQMALPPRLR